MDHSLDSQQSNGLAGASQNGNGNGPGTVVNGAVFVFGSPTGRSWEVVSRSLQQLFRNQTHLTVPFKAVSWHSIPKALAERGLYLQGVPAICAPVVRGNNVQDDLSTWTQEKLNALDMALQNRSIQILPREPVCTL